MMTVLLLLLPPPPPPPPLPLVGAIIVTVPCSGGV
jgi:hypothetical protein